MLSIMFLTVLSISVSVLTFDVEAGEAPRCPRVDNDNQHVHLPDTDCSKYWRCISGKAYLIECPDGFHFNKNSKNCDTPEAALCSIDGSSEELDSDEEVFHIRQYESEEQYELCPDFITNDCPAVDVEDSVYIPHPNCSQFCQCSNGLLYLHDCPDGLHFNPVLNVCDWPDDAVCVGGNDTGSTPTTTSKSSTTPTTITTPATGTGVLCLGAVTNTCPFPDGPDSVYIPHPNCSQFCQCSNGLPYLHNCPDDLHFNPVLNVCDWPEDAGCAGGNGTDLISTTTEIDTTTTETNGGHEQDATTESSASTTESTGTNELCPDEVVHECPAIDGKYPVYIPLPDCSQFCQCSNGLPYLHNCPDDLHFNAVLNVCDWPKDAGCAKGNGTDLIPTTTESSGGQESERTTTESSGSQDQVTTENSVTTTDNTGTNELCPDEVVYECPAVDGKYPVYIPLPNCSQFCQCSNGLPYLHNCPDDLHFNPILNVCDWPEDAGCAGGNGTDLISTTTESNGGQESETTTTGSSGDQEQDATTPGSGASTTENAGTNELCPVEVVHECPAVDGKYPVYIPLPNCSQFCQCSNGLPYLHNCPDDLHFNPILNVCDWPEDAGCAGGNGISTTTESNGGQESETITTQSSGGQDQDTTESSGSTTENTGTNELCPDEVVHECPAIDGKYPVYIPLPNCSQFCQCSNGLPYLHNCPDDLHFNPILNLCDWPEDAGCAGGNGISTTTENNGGQESETITTESSGDQDQDTTTESSTWTTENTETNELCPDEVVHECPAVDGKYPVYIPLPNCSQFCQCSNGLPYLHNCPDDLHFNPILNVCDWPEDAGCAKGNGTDLIPTTTESSGGQESERTTTESSGSQDQVTTENSVTTTDNTGTNELCPDEVVHECPAVDGKYPVYVPLPNCSQFCQCSNGLPYLHNCPDDLHFNPILNVCDWPEDAGCAGGNETDLISTTTESNGGQQSETTTIESDGGQDQDTTTETSTSTTESTGTNEFCPDEVVHECPSVDGKYPVYVPLPNCSQFCQCSNGLPYLHNCPDDLHFNAVLNVCDWPKDAGCAKGNGTDLIPTTTESSGGQESERTTTESSGSQDQVTTENSVTTTDNTGTNELCLDEVVYECPAVDGKYPVYIPLPNCSQFCQCSNGLPYLHNCPDDLHFNPVLNVCDWPEDAGCAGGNGISTTTENNGGQESETTTTESNGGQDQDTTPENSASTTENTRTNERCPDEVVHECPAVDGKYPVYIPLPNCSQFCQCSNGLPYLHNCPDDLHFNSVLNVCDWPEDAGCAGGNGTDLISTTTEPNGGQESGTTTTESSGGQGDDTATESSASTTENSGSNKRCPDEVVHECPAVDGKYPVYIPLPNCGQFCQCSNGLPYLHNCPDDLHFNPILNVCDWPQVAGCAGGNGTPVIATTTERQITTTQSNGGQENDTTTENAGTNKLCPDEVINECPAVDGRDPVYISLPNCSQFCQCSNGLPYLHNCPDGLHFNPVLNVCDTPQNAQCSSIPS